MLASIRIYAIEVAMCIYTVKYVAKRNGKLWSNKQVSFSEVGYSREPSVYIRMTNYPTYHRVTHMHVSGKGGR